MEAKEASSRFAVYHRTHATVNSIVTGLTTRGFDLAEIPNREESIAFAEVGGEMQLFTGYHVVKEGAGTAVDQHVLRVRRYSLTDGVVRWSVELTLPSLPALENVFLVGVTPDHVVLSARERDFPGSEISRNSVAVVLATADGATRWIRERFIPYAVAGDVIAGTTPKPDRSEEQNYVEAYHARTGAMVWRFAGYNIDRNDPFGHAVGPGLVQVTTNRGKSDGKRYTHLLEISSGKTVIRLDRPSPDTPFDCVHDQAKLTVCHLPGGGARAIVAYDATSYQRLWTFDENTPGRHVPAMLVAYHGLVYVGLGGTIFTPDNAATLDGTTGKDVDVDVDLGVVPDFVGPGYAIGRDRGYEFYRATR